MPISPRQIKWNLTAMQATSASASLDYLPEIIQRRFVPESKVKTKAACRIHDGFDGHFIRPPESVTSRWSPTLCAFSASCFVLKAFDNGVGFPSFGRGFDSHRPLHKLPMSRVAHR